MAKKKPSSPKRLEGKSVLLADDMIGWDPSDATLLIEEHGGRIVDVMGPDVDVVVVPKPDEGPPSRTERQAKSLNASGADIRILSEWELQQLVGPTRDEALRLLRGSRSDLARFQKYCDLLPYLHVADLSDSDLSEAALNLSRLVIDRCDLRGRKVTGSRILSAKGAKFEKATLIDSTIGDCEEASFDHAILRRIHFGNADDCTFRKAKFDSSNNNFIQSAPRANLDGATGSICIRQFPGGSARGLKGSLVFGSAPEKSDLTQADLSDCVLQWLRARDAIATGIRLVGASAKKSDVSSAQMESGDFTDARFPGLQGARCNFRKARLVRAQLNKAVLRGADIREADLTGANLKGANLEDADFRGATLTDADLTGANTSGTKFDS